MRVNAPALGDVALGEVAVLLRDLHAAIKPVAVVANRFQALGLARLDHVLDAGAADDRDDLEFEAFEHDGLWRWGQLGTDRIHVTLLAVGPPVRSPSVQEGAMVIGMATVQCSIDKELLSLCESLDLIGMAGVGRGSGWGWGREGERERKREREREKREKDQQRGEAGLKRTTHVFPTRRT